MCHLGISWLLKLIKYLYKDNILKSFVLDILYLLVMMVGGKFVIDDELKLLIYMAASRALAALTFSHIICSLKQTLNDKVTFSLIFSFNENAALLHFFLTLTFKNW